MSIFEKLQDRIAYDPVLNAMIKANECVQQFHGQQMTHATLDLLSMALFSAGFFALHYSHGLQSVTATNDEATVTVPLQG